MSTDELQWCAIVFLLVYIFATGIIVDRDERRCAGMRTAELARLRESLRRGTDQW